MADSKAQSVSNVWERLRVPVEQLTTKVDPQKLGFSSTQELASLEGTIGQERALRALEFGLNVGASGYNVFIAGVPGTGRNTTLSTYLQKAAIGRPVPDDWCYVHNFEDPLTPLALRLPAGLGRELQRDIASLVHEGRTRVPKLFESQEYRQRVEEAMRTVQERQRALTQEIVAEAKSRGVRLNITNMGMVATPLGPDGEPIEREEFEKLSEEEQEQIGKAHEELLAYAQLRLLELRELEKEASQIRGEVDREVVRYALMPLVADLRSKYGEMPDTLQYLDRLEEDMLEHLQQFRGGEEQSGPQAAAFLPAMRPQDPEELWGRYQVNVLVSNHRGNGAPVVIESTPTYYNLFGRVEYRFRMGVSSTDLSMVQPGDLHRANGGFLVLQARDVLNNALVWQTLKQVLRTREVRIENMGEQFSPIPTLTLRPQPIPVDVKVVLVGHPQLFRLLLLYDEDFHKLFKVKADFDTEMELTNENVRKYASFVVNRIQEEGLRHFDNEAIARLAEHSSRLVEDQRKMTTRFADVAQLVTESDHWAGVAGHDMVGAEDVDTAIAEKVYRSNLPEERLQEFYDEGTLKIDVDGAVTGQVNGLAVIDLGDYSFGRPSRITARVSLGHGEVINIDEESRLSGRIHNKGFNILVGYLAGKYGLDGPLPIRASIAFEQTYDEIDGDSASSTELYVLLSSLADVPILQGIAVTGSVNQFGDVQAVGGVTRKVEGFYEVCKARGLTGKQGVALPASNVKNLVLSQEVVNAVKEGRFHIYAVSTIEEGLEVLTGIPAGERQEDGTYPEGTLNHRVHAAIDTLMERQRALGRDNGAGGRTETVVIEAPSAGAPEEGNDRDKREGNGGPPESPPA
jgi:predicted ATP-dependent protease